MTQRPNILLILNDDMGFSDLGCYGGEIDTPNLDSLAENGLRLTQFYNTARCCPSRASLLTGLHPHQADVGHMVSNDDVDGYLGDLSRNAVTLAEVLKEVGYGTYMSGKWHVTRHLRDETYNWPCQRGFDDYYGIITGACSFFNPSTLTDNNERIETPEGDYFLTDAISDRAIRQLEDHRANHSDKPFFQYIAYTAPHWPLHAHPEDIAKYRGRFDKGWDALREERLERMVEMGLIHPDWQLTRRDSSQPEFSQAEHKAWQARRMEVYAAQIDRMDQGIGRILQSLKDTGQWDNTIIFFLADNGGCAEEVTEVWAERLRKSNGHKYTRTGQAIQYGNDPAVMPGGEETYQSYGVPWANLSNTPFREYKHWVHEGGIATPFIVHWPETDFERCGLRHRPAQLPDVMATCLELSGASYPATYKGNRIKPLEGYSMLPLFKDESFEREVLYWEHEGNRAVRKGKWKLVSKYPHDWELYDMERDRSETNDLASSHPDIVTELSELYDAWAKRCSVMPWGELLELREASKGEDDYQIFKTT